MKANAYDYKKQLAAEITHIERIQNLQPQLLVAVGSAMLPASVAIATLGVIVFADYVGCEQFFVACS